MQATPTRATRKKSLRTMVAGALVPVVLMAGLAGAAACEGSKVLFKDSFDDNLCNWPCSPERGKIENGKFTIQPKIGGFTYSSILPSYYFGDADICMTFRFAKTAGTRVSAGPLFWAEDYKNNYGVRVYSDGGLSVYREKDGKYNSMKYFEKSDAVKTGEGAENLVRVKIDGDVVTVYVNGQEQHKFRAQKPAQETKIGVYVAGEKGGAQVIEFEDVKITNVE